MSNKKKKRKNNHNSPSNNNPKTVNNSAKVQQKQAVEVGDKPLTAEDVEQEMVLTVAYEYTGSDDKGDIIEVDNTDTDADSENDAQNTSESTAADDISEITEKSDKSDETKAAEPTDKAADNGNKAKSIKHFTFPKKQKSEKATVEKKVDESSPAYLIRMITVLTVICMSIALLLAIVNKATVNVIAENAERKKSEAVLTVFPEGDETKTLINSDGKELYFILKSGKILGYAVNVSGSGYVGDIEMMVGVDTEHKIHGLKILSMSETPGVGSKAGADSFLDRFIGISDNVEIGLNFDGISGATFSSKGVAEGINKALSYDIDFESIAEELGLTSDDLNTDINNNVDIDVGSVGEIEVEPAPEPEPVIEPAPELEPVVEPTPEPEPVAEPVTKQEPVPVAEPVTEQEPTPVVEPVTEQEPAPVVEPVTEQEPTPVVEPVTEQEPTPVVEPVTEQEPTPVVEPVTEQEPATVTEPVPEQEPAPIEEPITETEPSSDEETATEEEPESTEESTSEQESEPVEEPSAEQEPSAGIVLNPRSDTEEEAEPTTEPEPEPEP